MIRAFVSSSHRRRLDAAAEFVHGRPAGADVVVVAPTREAADDFVRERTRADRATFGVRRLSFAQLASWLATPALAERGMAPASPLAAEAVAARAAFEAHAEGELPRLGPMLEFPGFPRALARTLGELRRERVAPAALEAAGAGEMATALARYGERLDQSALADRATAFGLASRSLDAGALGGGAVVVLLDVPVAGAVDRELVAALCARAADALVTVPAGDDATLEALAATGGVTREDAGAGDGDGAGLDRVRARLFADGGAPAAPADAEAALELFSAPGESRECVEVARRVLDHARAGVPFEAMAVLLRAPEAYADRLESAFRRARIPAWFARGTRRPDPSGRAFLALLACRAERLSARRFAEYLSFAQVPDLDPDGAPPATAAVEWVAPAEESLAPLTPPGEQLALDLGLPSAPARAARAVVVPPPRRPDADAAAFEGTLRVPLQWERLLVEAAVIGGRARWERRLRGLDAELRLKRHRLAAEEPDASRVAALARQIGQLGHLQRFALPVIGMLDALPAEASWGAWLDALDALAPRVLRAPDRVRGALAEMRAMGGVGPVSLEEVRAVLAPRLAVLETDPPAHRFGRVFVGSPEDARGRSFAIVFVPGLAERSFPQPPREDPLLLDDARARAGGGLETRRTRAARERLLLRLAVGAAEQRVVLSFPRLDVIEGRPRVPSFYGLDLVRAARGALPDPGALERAASAAGDARLSWPAPRDPARALDAVEHDLAALDGLMHAPPGANVRGRARYLLELSAPLGRALRARWVRWRPAWEPQDGLVRATPGAAAALAAHRPGARAYSVTALERFAACPYRFLLAAIHRLEPREAPGPLVQLDPLSRGAMIHAIQAETIRALRRAKVTVTPETFAAAHAVLEDAVDRVSARWADDLAPAIPRVWDDEVREIRHDLQVWLKRIAERAAEWRPRHVELTFGLPDADEEPGSVRDPVAIDGGWLLRGAIDLVEEQPGGAALRVVDHKTGANRTSRGLMVGGGETLQPVLYSIVVERVFGRPVAEGRLDFCTSRGGFTSQAVPMQPFARYYAMQTLAAIGGAIERGVMPPAPKEDACAWCDFLAVCGPAEQHRWKRKHATAGRHGAVHREVVEMLDLLRELRSQP